MGGPHFISDGTGSLRLKQELGSNLHRARPAELVEGTQAAETVGGAFGRSPRSSRPSASRWADRNLGGSKCCTPRPALQSNAFAEAEVAPHRQVDLGRAESAEHVAAE